MGEGGAMLAMFEAREGGRYDGVDGVLAVGEGDAAEQRDDRSMIGMSRKGVC